MADLNIVDVEKSKEPVVADWDDADSGTVEEIKAKQLQKKTGFLRTLRRGEEWLDAKLGVETQGIDRIPEEERHPPSIWNILFLWWSMNTHIANVPVGMLGPQFGLSFRQSIGASIGGIILGALCVGFTGTLGPKLGMRQIACARYSFGFWGTKICSGLNIIVGGGFAVVNYVAVGQILSAVSNYQMSITVGIVIVALLSYLISVFGFRIIHVYEKFAWIPIFIIMCVLLGQVAPFTDTSAPATHGGLGLTGSILTIFAINFALSSGSCSIAADYYVNYPTATPAWKVFLLTMWGNVLSLGLVVTVGTCLGTTYLSTAPNNHKHHVAYNEHGLGGLLLVAFYPDGWAKFALIVFTFSVLGANIVITYSAGLCLQLLGHYMHAIPRFILSFVVALIVAVLAIAGQESLSLIVSNFVSLLGYWTVSFTFILLIEDQCFRRHEGYNLLVWDQPNKLPLGAAAVFSLLAGYLGGGVPGMSQSWYNGPVSLAFGPGGGDCGIYLSGGITLLLYPILRTIEKRKMGR